jgi:hypothetical protein
MKGREVERLEKMLKSRYRLPNDQASSQLTERIIITGTGELRQGASGPWDHLVLVALFKKGV